MGKDYYDDSVINDDNELKAAYGSWDKVGRTYYGVLVAKDMADNKMKPGTKTTIYTLANAMMKDDASAEKEEVEGGTINIYGRGAKDPQIISGLDKAKMGQVVVATYAEEGESTKVGYQPFKVIKVYSPKDKDENAIMDLDVLKEYRQDHGEVDIADVEMPDVDTDIPFEN